MRPVGGRLEKKKSEEKGFLEVKAVRWDGELLGEWEGGGDGSVCTQCTGCQWLGCWVFWDQRSTQKRKESGTGLSHLVWLPLMYSCCMWWFCGSSGITTSVSVVPKVLALCSVQKHLLISSDQIFYGRNTLLQVLCYWFGMLQIYSACEKLQKCGEISTQLLSFWWSVLCE